MSKFRHPNLVILMGFAVNGTQRLLVYECLSGGDVARRLQRCAREGLPFTFQQRLSVALDAACGLSHLHNASPKVYHRDIKAANILLDRNGGAKMADFGLACLSRSSEHKVKQASGTIGYACPYYIQRGVVTEGSEVYSFGMVLIELLCNAPPACSGSAPGEILYLVNHLQGSVARCLAMADPKANFPPAIATRLAELAMTCVSMNETVRPKFSQIVKALRALCQDGPSALMSSPTRPPLSPTVKPRVIDLIRLDAIQSPSGVDASILHSCSLEESLSGCLPPLRIGRHCQPAVFDSLVPTDALKGTISREHFQLSFQSVTRSANLVFHATITNNSINSISVNDKVVLERGQSSFVYAGDRIAFLALVPGSSDPSAFLVFGVTVLQSQLIQAVRPVAANNTNNAPASAESLPENKSLDMSVVSSVGGENSPANVAKEGLVCVPLCVPPSVPVCAPPSIPANVPANVSAQTFCLHVYGGGGPVLEAPGTGPLRVGRSFQSESFWRSLAPDACPAISREHFHINRCPGGGFSLCCTSMNGVAVRNVGAAAPVLLNKDASVELLNGAEIELAGTIRLLFSVAGTRSAYTVSRAAAPFGSNKLRQAAPTSGSFIGSEEDDDYFPDDVFAKTGFR